MFIMGYDGSWEPRLIKSFDIDPTGLVYTMHLQEGVKWHTNHGDWGEMDADDLIFTLEQLSRKGSNHVQGGNARRIFGCDECQLTKIDNLTVELKRPTPTFQLTWFSQAPIPGFSLNSKKHFESVGEDAALLQDVGTGPWEQVEFKTDQFRKVKAVEDHWRKTPEFAEMIWHDIPEQSTRLANFLVGDLDTGIFNAESRMAIKDAQNPGVKFMKFPGAIIQMIWLEGGNYTPDSRHHAEPDPLVRVDPVGSDYAQTCELRAWIACDREVGSAGWEKARKVREAMTISIDRQKLVNNIAFGEGEPWYVGVWANQKRMQQFGLDKLTWDYDVARAKELLIEAGYPDGFEAPVALRQGTGDLIVNMEAVAVMWEEIGLHTSTRNVQPSAYRVQSNARKTLDAYGLNDAPSFPEPLRVYSTVYSSSANSIFGVNHPVMDQLIEDTEAETKSEEKRWEIQADLARFLFDNVLSMPLYAENAVWPLGPEVDAWKAAPAELDWLSYWEYPARRK